MQFNIIYIMRTKIKVATFNVISGLWASKRIDYQPPNPVIVHPEQITLVCLITRIANKKL